MNRGTSTFHLCCPAGAHTGERCTRSLQPPCHSLRERQGGAKGVAQTAPYPIFQQAIDSLVNFPFPEAYFGLCFPLSRSDVRARSNRLLNAERDAVVRHDAGSLTPRVRPRGSEGTDAGNTGERSKWMSGRQLARTGRSRRKRRRPGAFSKPINPSRAERRRGSAFVRSSCASFLPLLHTGPRVR